MIPLTPMWYCRHPDGGRVLELHGICVALISHVLTVEAVVAKVKAKAAVVPVAVPMSM